MEVHCFVYFEEEEEEELRGGWIVCFGIVSTDRLLSFGKASWPSAEETGQSLGVSR